MSVLPWGGVNLAGAARGRVCERLHGGRDRRGECLVDLFEKSFVSDAIRLLDLSRCLRCDSDRLVTMKRKRKSRGQ
jgi:hypothetical protein